jgi:hypothetical protein
MPQRPGSVGIYTCDDGTFEVPTSKCAHCPKLTEIPNQRRIAEFVDVCRMCNALICLECAGKPCAPHMRNIEAAERAAYARSQFAKSMGF